MHWKCVTGRVALGWLHWECCYYTNTVTLGVFHFECWYYITIVSLRVFHFDFVLGVLNWKCFIESVVLQVCLMEYLSDSVQLE